MVEEAPTTRSRKLKNEVGDKPVVFSREEAARKLGLSLPSIKRAIVRGDLGVNRIGRRVLVPAVEVERYGALLLAEKKPRK